MSNIFFSADYHWGHSNEHGGIISMCKRPFSNLHEMEKAIIDNHNSMVKPDDDFWLLGDVAYKCSPQYLVERLRMLNGNIFVILGNHDKPLRQVINHGMVDDLIKSKKLTIIGSLDPNIISAYQLKPEGAHLILSHYKYSTWIGSFRGYSINVYGHSHGNMPEFTDVLACDCGVDVNGFSPVPLQAILKKIELRREWIRANNKTVVDGENKPEGNILRISDIRKENKEIMKSLGYTIDDKMWDY